MAGFRRELDPHPFNQALPIAGDWDVGCPVATVPLPLEAVHQVPQVVQGMAGCGAELYPDVAVQVLPSASDVDIRRPVAAGLFPAELIGVGCCGDFDTIVDAGGCRTAPGEVVQTGALEAHSVNYHPEGRARGGTDVRTSPLEVIDACSGEVLGADGVDVVDVRNEGDLLTIGQGSHHRQHIRHVAVVGGAGLGLSQQRWVTNSGGNPVLGHYGIANRCLQHQLQRNPGVDDRLTQLVQNDRVGVLDCQQVVAVGCGRGSRTGLVGVQPVTRRRQTFNGEGFELRVENLIRHLKASVPKEVFEHRTVPN
ncbi:MAG: hypothetical protein N3E40_01420 [Dehalococcoidia bacterium]|nr:hypothetical protein [Dehalococcoidia bacterium]